MGTWIIWLVVAAVLGVVEIVTARLAFGLMAVAGLVGAAVGAAVGPQDHLRQLVSACARQPADLHGPRTTRSVCRPQRPSSLVRIE